MRKCPKCGNQYRPDITVCPNDGTRLAPADAPAAPPVKPPIAGPPPAAGPPPTAAAGRKKQASKDRPKPKPSIADYAEPGSLRETSSARTWIWALIVCLAMFGVFAWAKDRLNPPPEGAAEATVEDGEDIRDTKKRKKRRGKRQRRAASTGEERSFDDYDWEQDFVVDDRPLGDIRSEPEHVEYEEVAVREPEPYEPKRNEYQPDGSYRPVAKYAEPGADNNVVEIDLSSASSSSPLDESQVKSVLNVRRLAPCYDRWVQKIPQMKGRVWMTFVVAGDGHVASVKITRSQLRSRVVEKCIVDRARRLNFPRSEGGQTTKFDTHFDFTNR